MTRPGTTARVVVLATGGTIAATHDATGALTPGRSADALLAGIDVPHRLHVTAHRLMAMDSAAMTPADMAGIAARTVAEARAGADGIVVLHGTDTMEESALVADLAVAQARTAAPVVFTGAQRGADHPEPDGPGNLLLALHIAGGAPGSPGARIVFAGKAMPVWGTRKTSTVALDGFESWPDMREADAARRRGLAAFAAADGPASEGPLPRVDTVALYPGADAAAIDAVRAAGARGLVLEAMGAGNANAVVVQAVREAVAAGVAVVVTTRVPCGPAFADYGGGGGGGGGADLAGAGAVFSPVLRSGQARVLLAALLGAGAGPGDVARAFTG
ncbi:asparaginase [Tomitella cavernea]|uniref:asparaginase n=1 Tax=Tomitella cavernea TaxID=1387982 RepID=A0ABP9C923_9ACTN|nr:asparaginase domain-containing protein [Tomitella cavernea]